MREHPVRVLLWQGHVKQGFRDLPVHVIFAEILLPARFPLLGAAEIDVALLSFIGHHAAAFTAGEHPFVQVGLGRFRLGSAGGVHDLLHRLKQGFGNQRLVLSLMQFSVVADEATVDGVLEEPVVVALGEDAASDTDQSQVVDLGLDLGEGVVAGGVRLECQFDQRSPLGVDDNGSALAIIEIAYRCGGWPDAVCHLLANPTLDILRKVVHVVFALAEHHAEHEFARSVGLERDIGEFQVADDARIHKVDDAATIKGVAGESVGMPCQNAGCFSGFNASKHFIEDGTPRSLGCHLLDEDLNNVETLLRSNLPEFGLLVLDTANLTRRVVGRFASVHEVPDGFVLGHDGVSGSRVW